MVHYRDAGTKPWHLAWGAAYKSHNFSTMCPHDLVRDFANIINFQSGMPRAPVFLT